ncbi:MAG: metallophosphoesterase [Hyphomicrobium sp.]|uniref:metallophosphoesterase family protein n=1 Tax=Hyphomicrobium sp. TaxID=82 RepID=UPI003D0DCD15
MTETFTLVHLSDAHLGPIAGFRLGNLNIKRAFGFLNWQRHRRFVHVPSVAERLAADALAHAPDHIAVTGDLANLGLPGEFVTGLGWLKSLGEPHRVSVVPGNHDIYTGQLGGPSCLETWAPYMRGSESWTETSPVHFPYERTVGQVALIGLNSSIPTPPGVAGGRVGPMQLAALARSLERLGEAGYIRVVLIHHPPLPGQATARRALEDAAALADVLARHGAELVLHGHNHKQSLAWLKRGDGGGIPVLGVASASAAFGYKAEPPARYHLLRIRRADGEVFINCEVRGLDGEGHVARIARDDLVMPSP